MSGTPGRLFLVVPGTGVVEEGVIDAGIDLDLVHQSCGLERGACRVL
jgi:hypothetical protein